MPRLLRFLGAVFTVPRALGDTSVPEVVAYDDPEDPGIRCTIAIFNDEPIPHAHAAVLRGGTSEESASELNA